jgi:hypothetical protein
MIKISDGKTVDDNGAVVRPEIGNKEHIKLINAKRREPKPKFCSKFGCNAGRKPFKIEQIKPVFRLKIIRGKLYDENGKVVPIEIGNSEQIELLSWGKKKKKPAKYLCSGCVEEDNKFKSASK